MIYLYSLFDQVYQVNMNIQIISDIHLEFYDDPKMADFVQPSAPNLLICGDFGIPYLDSYEKLIAECSDNFKNIFLITGNHEYYQHKNDNPLTMGETDTKIELIVQKYPNVHFLNNRCYELNDEYIILGSTLWSYVPRRNIYDALDYIKDYEQIYYAYDKHIDPKYINKVHEQNVKWLKENISKFSNKKIIIMTHHLPSFQLIDEKYEGNTVNCCFASDLDMLMKGNVKYWFAGHTHSSFNKKINDTQCIGNPKGYYDENPNYNKELVILLR